MEILLRSNFVNPSPFPRSLFVEIYFCCDGWMSEKISPFCVIHKGFRDVSGWGWLGWWGLVNLTHFFVKVQTSESS